jgi:hypothetical protein
MRGHVSPERSEATQVQWRAAGPSKPVLGRDLGRRLRRESETSVSQSCVWHFAKRQKGACAVTPLDPPPCPGGSGAYES